MSVRRKIPRPYISGIYIGRSFGTFAWTVRQGVKGLYQAVDFIGDEAEVGHFYPEFMSATHPTPPVISRAYLFQPDRIPIEI